MRVTATSVNSLRNLEHRSTCPKWQVSGKHIFRPARRAHPRAAYTEKWEWRDARAILAAILDGALF